MDGARCPACGAPLFEGAELCFDCGEPIDGSKLAPAPSPPPPPPAPTTTPPTTKPIARPARRRDDDEEKVRCRGCGVPNARDAERCRGCGSPIQRD